MVLVHGTEDPAITTTLAGSVPHEQLARFDNNIGQRTVAVQAAEPDGGLRTSGTVSDATTDTRFSLPPRSPAASVDEEIT